MNIGLHAKNLLLLSEFNENQKLSQEILEKYSSVKFHKNPSSGSQVVPCGLTEGQTDITKRIIVFHSFAHRHTHTHLTTDNNLMQVDITQ